MPENINYLEKVDAMVGLRGLTKGTHTYYLSMCRRFLNWCDTKIGRASCRERV